MATESSTLTEMPMYGEKHQEMNDELDNDIATIRAESENDPGYADRAIIDPV